MTDLVKFLREGGGCLENGNECKAIDARSGCTCAEAADLIEALQSDNARLDKLMSDIAMAWVRMPHQPRGQVPSALDLAISRAADFTTGLHREKNERGGNA